MTTATQVSFLVYVGDTGTGKSWILRSLLMEFPNHPTPLSSPGKLSNVVVSTSCDVNLYADGASSSDDDPILFLDFEELNGTDLPCTYIHPQRSSTLSDDDLKTLVARRRHYAEKIYPRLAYVFSDCIVFVTTNTMQGREGIAELIASFVNAAHGTRFQSFKPALIIVYNKFANNDDDWSGQHCCILEPVEQLRGAGQATPVLFRPHSCYQNPTITGDIGSHSDRTDWQPWRALARGAPFGAFSPCPIPYTF
jgi:hypothetical protein